MYTYRQDVLEGLASHGLIPRADTPPNQLRDAVRDLYRYEIRVLRDRLIAGEFPKHEYAGRVILLRQRYWLLSVPLPLWLEPEARNRE
ncbi:MAG TPA: hypothetical protein VL475_03910 [Planctomycetaceae bacterium]|nr:hypothetical protein [Planctomycetaceae bacterium]